MKTETPIYPIYDLSNRHFSNVQLTDNTGKILKGQFVQFKVVKGKLEYLYPSEKYCFILDEKKNEFWSAYDKNNGEFDNFPAYVLLLSLSQIRKIQIEPTLL